MFEPATDREASQEYRSCWTSPDGTLAMDADNFGWGPVWAAVGALFGTVATGFFAWLAQRSRGDAQRDIAIIAQWEKLTGALSDRITDLEKAMAVMRSNHSTEIEAIRRAHAAEIDEMRKTHRAEMKALREQNAGLQRMIIQTSQSTAMLMGDNVVTPLKSAFPTIEDEGDGK